MSSSSGNDTSNDMKNTSKGATTQSAKQGSTNPQPTNSTSSAHDDYHSDFSQEAFEDDLQSDYNQNNNQKDSRESQSDEVDETTFTSNPTDQKGLDESEFEEVLSDKNEAKQRQNAQDFAQYVTNIAELEATLSVKDQEIEDWKNKAYRFSADLQNLSKQNQLDLQQARKKGKQTVIDLILPFINTMNLSFSYIPQSEDESLVKFVETLQGSFDKLIGDLGASGIEILVPQPGDQVDPEFMSVLNATGEEDEDVVVARVVGVGVRIDGQLVQEASVMV